MATSSIHTTLDQSVANVWKCPDPLPQSLHIKLFTCSVEAGFPSPAEDHIETTLDINDLLIEHPAATFFVRVAGDSMIEAGIHAGDVLVVDRSKTAIDGNIIIALVNGDYTVKRLSVQRDEIMLCPENANYQPIRLSGLDELIVWGVVTGLARQF
jgi:DNA polymerase V